VGVSQGEAEQDSREMAIALLQTLVQEHICRDQEFPKLCSPGSRKYRAIRLPAMQAAKAGLYRQFKPSGLRKIDLARRIGIPKSIVDRLFDLKHHSRLEQLEAAFRVLGKELTIEIRDAA
jgi:antitoxin HicB